MKKEKLTISKDPLNNGFYIASYTGDEGDEAHKIAYNSSIAIAIEESLNIWGLNENDVYMEASN